MSSKQDVDAVREPYIRAGDYEGYDRRRCPAWSMVRRGLGLERKACSLPASHKGKHNFSRDYNPLQYVAPELERRWNSRLIVT